MTAFMVANIKLVLMFALVGTMATLSRFGRRDALRAAARRGSRPSLSVY